MIVVEKDGLKTIWQGDEDKKQFCMWSYAGS